MNSNIKSVSGYHFMNKFIESSCFKSIMLKKLKIEDMFCIICYTGQQKKTLFSIPFPIVNECWTEWCDKHIGVFRFSNFVLFFPYLYVEIGKITLLAIFPLELLLLYTLICITILPQQYIKNRTLFLYKKLLRTIAYILLNDIWFGAWILPCW